MKNFFGNNKIVSKVCLLLMVGILLITVPFKSEATAPDNDSSTTVSDPLQTGGDRVDLFDEGIGDGNGLNSFSITYDNGNGELNGSLRIFLTLTALSFLPAALVMLTSYTRIIIVMHFTRTALGTQSTPPNQVLIGISLFLTLFIMGPVFVQINEQAIKPFEAGEITQQEALKIGMEPIRQFMYGQTQSKDVASFMQIAGLEWDGQPDSIPTTVLIPSFILSELRTAFIIGFLIYIPFIVIDMVVSSVLMSMGMMMLPPTTISMPFKILLFVLADGWNLVIVNLVKSFY